MKPVLTLVDSGLPLTIDAGVLTHSGVFVSGVPLTSSCWFASFVFPVTPVNLLQAFYQVSRRPASRRHPYLLHENQ